MTTRNHVYNYKSVLSDFDISTKDE